MVYIVGYLVISCFLLLLLRFSPPHDARANAFLDGAIVASFLGELVTLLVMALT